MKDLLLAISGWHIEDWRQRFAALLPDRRIVAQGDAFASKDIGYVACWKHARGSLAALSNARALFSLGAGVDHLVSDPALPDAPIVRVVDVDLTARMSEWVVWQCLDWLRQGGVYRRQQAAGEWIDDRFQPAAADVRVGVMGLGVLGQDAARRLRDLRFDVTGWSRTPKALDGMPTFHGEEGLADFLARTDLLVVLLPLTDETRGILNAALFGRLARNGRLGGPVLLNAGRGGLQVEADIVAALAEGVLAGASLDVFETEPLPADSPLWRHPRVTITPHNAAMSAPDAIAGAIAEQIRALEAGRPLRNVVDRNKGY
jgi:glyoxylate/hydroxypyruvate reductase A